MAVEVDEHLLTSDEIPVDISDVSGALASADIAVLPERFVAAPGGEQVALFRREVGLLQSFARTRNIRVALAIPTGTETAAYQEHDAAWVLPLLVFASDYSLALSASFMVEWVKSLIGDHPSTDQRLLVRYGRRTPEGEITVLEADGPAPEVIKALRKVADAPEKG